MHVGGHGRVFTSNTFFCCGEHRQKHLESFERHERKLGMSTYEVVTAAIQVPATVGSTEFRDIAQKQIEEQTGSRPTYAEVTRAMHSTREV
jgi:hypothetical protein